MRLADRFCLVSVETLEDLKLEVKTGEMLGLEHHLMRELLARAEQRDAAIESMGAAASHESVEHCVKYLRKTPAPDGV